MAVAILVFRQIASLKRRPALPVDWTADLSVDRYRPMYRLLDEDDIRFLRSQPGSTPALVKRLRRQRCRVFRSYLRSLERDFQVASEALMLILVQSPSDRRDAICALLATRVKFAVGIFRVRCRLLLYRWNVGRESVATLLSLFEELQLELLALVPTPDGAGVQAG
jgi:hypothetical protein